MSDRLDVLLEETRPPEPADDGFTQMVMERVRTEAVPLRRRGGRFFTRPIVLAAAAVLVTGGALAAVRSVTAPGPTPSAAPAPETAELRVANGSSPQITSRVTEPGATTALPSVGEPVPGRNAWRDGDYEWGYTSDHTAYVIDHRTGLKLVTETYTNTVAVGTPHEVTVTLHNTSDQAIGIYSPDGCALAVGTFGSADEAPFDPAAPRDASSEAWRCAGTDTETGGQAQKWVIPAGSSRTRDAEVVLESAGDWVVFGMCRCEIVSAADGDGGDDPLGPLTQFTLQLPTDPEASSSPPSGDKSSAHALVTPPIRLTAS